MQHLQDLAAESCAGICLLHISYEFAKLAVAKHRLRDSSPQSTDSKSDALSMRPRGLLQPSHTPHAPAVNLKRHAQLLVCRSAATTLPNPMLILTRRSFRGLVVEYIVAIDVAQARFPAVACSFCWAGLSYNYCFR